MNSRERKLAPLRQGFAGQGFTLIELLVVIAIIGILATLSVVALNNARAKSRDAKRVADIKNIQTALALYYNDKKEYPITLTAGQPLFSTSLDGAGNIVTSTYISAIPSAPTPADGSNCNTTNNTLTYSTSSDLQTYTLSTCVSSPPQTAASSSGAAIYIADPTQSQPCGQYMIDYAGQKYRTIQIGTQCWMRDNLNVGTMIPALTTSTNNGLIEKYCYADNAANCVTSGGLYQWEEAKNYLSAGSQGICPAGWHVPIDNEMHTLEEYLTDPGGTCVPNRHGASDCSSAGTKLQVGGSSGFDGLLAGYLYDTTHYYNNGTRGMFWSSSDGLYYWRLDTATPTVFSTYNHKYYGFSIRCLKN